MPSSSHPGHHTGRPLRASGLLATLILLAGYAATVGPVPDINVEAPARPLPTTDETLQVPVVRYGRYTLVELVPQTAQQDLMQQVIDVSMPGAQPAKVGDALRYVLQRSGYQLCADGEATTLYALPLPAAHLHLGPLPLRDALLTLAGSAWDLQIDEAERRVCFVRHMEAGAPKLPIAQPSTLDAAMPLPIPAPSTITEVPLLELLP